MTGANAHWAADISDAWLLKEVAARLKMSELRYEALAKAFNESEDLKTALKELVGHLDLYQQHQDCHVVVQAHDILRRYRVDDHC